MQELAEMATFAEVVERGSFTAAAEALGVSKSFVSKHVSGLEARLGLVLLRRTTRRLKLTEEGERFHDYCRHLVDTARAGFQLMRSRSHEVSGLLRISAPITFGQVFLPQLLLGFRDAFPRVEVDLILENRKVDLLSESFEVAFRITESPPESLFMLPLGVMEDIICAAPAYLERHDHPTIPGELNGHECLLYLNPGRATRWTFRRDRRVEVVDVAGKMATNHHHALLHHLLAGAGIAKVPEYCVTAALAEGRLKRLLSDYQSDTIPIYLIHHDPTGQPPRVREFLKFTREWFAKG